MNDSRGSTSSDRNRAPPTPGPGAPRADLRAQILAASRAQPSPTRGSLRMHRAAAAIFSAAWMGVCMLAMHAHRPPEPGIALLVLWTLGALILTVVVFSWGTVKRTSLGAPTGVLRSLAPILGMSVFAGAIAAGLLLQGEVAPSSHHYARCWIASLVVAVGPLLASLWVERRSDPVHPRATGAGIGAVAGAWSGVAMSFVCGRSDPLHTLVSHIIVLWLVTVIGALAGQRLLAMKSV